MKAERISVVRPACGVAFDDNRSGGRRPRRRALAVSIGLAMTAAAVGTVLAPTTAMATQSQSPSVATSRQATARDYSIPAGPLATALRTFAVTSGVHVDYSTGLVGGKTSQGVTGHFVPAVALRALLYGTGLESRSVNATTFVVRKAPQAGNIDPPQTSSPSTSRTSRVQSKPQTLGTIVVTGTHIRAAELATANPVITVSAQQIAETGALTVGQVIQDLPSVTGAVVTPHIDNQGTSGREEVGLRGLGPARTLVLVNGQRFIGDDLGLIPAVAISRIEVMTTGASSVYGSDAIGGVVNIILKSHFQGAQFQMNYGISDHDDGQRQGYSFMFGQTSDKGSIVAGVSYNQQDAISQLSRKFSSRTLSLTGSTNTPIHTIPGGSTFSPRSVTFVPPSLRGKFGCPEVTLNKSAVGQTQPVNLSDFHCTTAEDHFSYSAYRPLTQPVERENGFINGVYHLTPNIDALFTGLYNKTHSSFTLGPPVWATLTGVEVSKDSVYNPFGVTFSPTSGNLLLSRLTTIGNRVTPTGRSTEDMMLGLRGTQMVLGQNWQWKVGYDYGHTSATTLAEGLPILSALNPGLGPSMLDPATGQYVCVSTPGDLNTIIAGCTPWDTFNLHNPASLKVVQAPGTTATGMFETYTIERIMYASINGGVVNLPAGTAQLALGVSKRTEYLHSVVGSGLLSDPHGLCPLSSQCTSPVRGGYDVKEAYGELLVPVLHDLPGVHSLNVDLGDRYSKYSDFGSTSDTHIGVQFRPVADLLLRGNVSEVFRAPTIGNIFAGITFGGTTLNTDPCDHITSPNPACVGVPTDGSFVDTAVASHQQVNTLGSGSALAGFPLGPENGKSFDFGVVWSPKFVPGHLDLSTDFWRIYLNNEITGVSADTVLTACFNGLKQFCPLIDRFGSGTPHPGQLREIHAPTANLGRIDVKGVDFKASYQFPHFSFGQIGIHLLSTYMSEYKEETAPGLPGNQVFNLVGNINTDLGGGLGIFMPRIRAQARLNWQLGPWSAVWRARFTDRFDLGSHVVSRHYSAIPGFKVPYVLHYGAYVYNNLAVAYDATKIHTQFSLGINNVFDKQPPVFYYNDTGLGNGDTDGADFDVIGRFYWLRMTVRF